MDRSKLSKSQGRININAEASEKLLALFSQESDTSLVSSIAECSADDQGEATPDPISTSTIDRNFNTCVGVNSLPKIVITSPQPADGNGTKKERVVASTISGAEEHSIKLLPLPISQLRQPERICSASSRRTPASSNVKKSSQPPPLKLPLLKPERISSASLRRNKQPFIRSYPSPIGEEKEEELANKFTGDTSAPVINNDKERSHQESKSTAEQPSPSSNTKQSESGSQEAGEEIKGDLEEIQCPITGTTYNDLYSNEDKEDDDCDDDDDCDEDDNDDDCDNDNGDDDDDDDDCDNNDGGDTDSDSDSDDDNRQTNQYVSERPISGTNRQFSNKTFDEIVFPHAVISRYQRRAAVKSPLAKTRSMPSLSKTSDKQLPAAVSAGVQPKLLAERKREPSRSQLLIQKMTSEFALTPLKMIAKELMTVHYDVYPTEISPAINRSPSFIGIKSKDDGLMSGRFSPKLDIPRHRYCGRMIKQHPLVRYSYKMTDRRLAKIIKMLAPPSSSSSSSSSSYGQGDCDHYDLDSHHDEPQEEPVAIKKKVSEPKVAKQVKEDNAVDKQQKNITTPIPKENSYLKLFTNKLGLTKPVKELQPFKEPSGYLEIYKKRVGFSNKNVLPPIASKPTEDKQKLAPLLKPTPPQSQPSSGQAASFRKMRRARLESQLKNKTSSVGKKQ